MFLRPSIPILATASSLFLGCSDTTLYEAPHALDQVSVPVAGLVDRCIIPDDSLGPIDMQTGEISEGYAHYQGIFANHLAAQFEAHGYNYDAFRAGDVPFTLVATGKKYPTENRNDTAAVFDVLFAPGNHYDEWVNFNQIDSDESAFWLGAYLDEPVFMMACSFGENDYTEQPYGMPDYGTAFNLSQRFYVGDELPTRSYGADASFGLDSLLFNNETFMGNAGYSGQVRTDSNQGCTPQTCGSFFAQPDDHLLADAVNQFSRRIYQGLDWLSELTGLASVSVWGEENSNTSVLVDHYFDSDIGGFIVSNQVILYCHNGTCYQNGDE